MRLLQPIIKYIIWISNTFVQEITLEDILNLWERQQIDFLVRSSLGCRQGSCGSYHPSFEIGLTWSLISKMIDCSIDNSLPSVSGLIQLLFLWNSHLSFWFISCISRSPGKDFICIQSMDGTLSFFEQETFAFSRFLPGFLLPGPIKYARSIDSFVTASTSRQIECYKLVFILHHLIWNWILLLEIEI